MIIIKVMGGLASQLNKYALGRSVALRLGTRLKLDVTPLIDPPPGDTPWTYQLDKFAIEADVATPEEIARVRRLGRVARLKRSLCRRLKLPYRADNAWDIGRLTREEFERLPDGVYLSGEAGGDTFYRDWRPQLLKEMRPIVPPTPAARAHADAIAASAWPVSIHVRRGDFLSNPNAARFHEVAGVEYFTAAVARMREHHPDARFFVFSDDPAWVEAELMPALPADTVAVAGLENHEDLVLMSSCRGNIISNSGFSWTAAWINDAPDKLVMAPDRWYKDAAINELAVASIRLPGMILVPSRMSRDLASDRH